MNKIIVSILIVFSFFGQLAYSNWEKVTNMPPQYLNTYWLDVHFLDDNPDYGWVCGYGGRIIRTTDGGNSWRGTTIIATDQLESIYFVNENVGYASGEGIIFKSVDGGATWLNVTPPNVDVLLWGSFFLTENLGFVIGGSCQGPQRFYRTTNGGATWSNDYHFFPNSKLADLMIDPATGLGYAAGSGLIWKTTDFGKTWDVFARTGGMDWHEEITNIGKSFLIPYSVGCDGTTTGFGGNRFSVDDGKTWRDFRTNAPMYGTFLLDELRGWACGLDEEIYYTSDGGKNWKLENCGVDAGAGLDDIRFIDDTTGWVVGQGIYRYKRNSIPQPEIFADGQTELCQGDSLTLTLLGDYGSFLWSTGETTRSITVDTSGSYSVFVRNSKCEYAYSPEIKVTIRPSPEINILSSATAPPCQGDTVLLTLVSPASSILWSTGSLENSIKVTESGSYSIAVQDDFGCKDSASINIQFMPLPSPRLQALTRTSVCVGDSVLLEVVPHYPQVTWYNQTKTLIATGNFLLTGDEGFYFAEVTDENGCQGVTDSIKVTVREETNRLVLLIDSTRKEFFIDSTRYPDLACRYFSIRNVSSLPITLAKGRLYYNLSFSLPQSQFPIYFEPNETKDFLVCYSPRSLRYERDTLVIEDVCNDHNLPILAYGEGNLYSGSTRCDIPIELETIKIESGTNFVTTSAYPNPTSKNATIAFTSFIAKKDEGKFDVAIFDVFGNEKGKFSVETLTSQELETGRIESGSLHVDLSNLPRGIYIAKISLGIITQFKKIVLE